MLQGSSAPCLSSLGINGSSRDVQKEESIYFFTFQSERDLFLKMTLPSQIRHLFIFSY